MATQKSLSFQKALKDALAARLSLTLTEGFDANGDPTLLVGAAAANAAGCFIRIKPEASLQKDVLGLPQNVFTPHIVQVAFEGNAGATAPDAANTIAILLPILGEVLVKGIKTEIWLETDGSVPAVTTFDTASKKKASFDSLYSPLMSGQ